ncbi:sortase [Candidatus Nanosynbacter sp. TM7-074]|uniref:Sortase n=1 Tax=Candidatus Nanosynbacter sp. TM7-074 TaxID=3158573 RepID=A0AB39JCB2_9BACT
MSLQLKSSTRQSKNWKVRLPSIIATIMIISGLYTLAIAITPFILSQTIDQKNNSTTQLISKTENKITENRLYIPKIDINLPYAPGGAETMEHGAWWRKPENGNPKDGGNFVLSAHRFIMGLTPQQTLRKSPFYNIDKLTVSDDIVIDYNGERYIYVISEKRSVKPEAIEIEQRTDQPQLTLYSCTLGGANDGRDVLIAKLKK